MLDIGGISAVRRALRGAVVTGVWYTGDALRIWFRRGSRSFCLDVWVEVDCQLWDGDQCVDMDAAPILVYELRGPGDDKPKKQGW